ncbi:MAG: RNA polymerase sigma factor [Planctomycetota bacterium]
MNSPIDDDDSADTQAATLAFEQLYSLHFSRLVFFLEKWVEGSTIDAQDVAQDAMIRAWMHRDHYDPRFAFTTWLYRIARNSAVDQIRSAQRRTAVSIESMVEFNGGTALPAAKSVKGAWESESDDFGDAWETARACLTKTQYTALWLRYAEAMTIAEIAVATGRTQIATRVLLHRSRRQLAKVMRLSRSTEEQIVAFEETQ